MPRVKQIIQVVDEDLANDSDNTHLGHVLDSDSDGMADVPREYSIGFFDSVPLPWVKPLDNRVIFTNPPLSKKPFPEAPSSGLILSMDKTMKPAFDSVDCNILGDFVEKSTFYMGHTLLRCRLQRGEFSWTSWKSEAPTQVNKVWNKWVFTTLFEECGDFLSRLEEGALLKLFTPLQRWCSQTHTFVTLWGDFSRTLEDVVMLLQLPVFCNLDITNFYVDPDLRKLARDLQCSLSDAGRYAKELSKSRRVSKSHSRDKRSDARRGSSKNKEVVDEDETRSSKKKKCTVKYSFSNWSRYFFGDFLNGEFAPASDDIPVDLKEAAFIVYWLSKDYPSGAMICPITYRPNRVSRQLGWDQDPKNVEPAFYPIKDLMKKVLFRSVLPKYDPSLVVPFHRIGGITMEYVDYLKCVKKHIRQYKGQFAAELKSFTSVLVKDPYFMIGNLSPTTIVKLDAKCYKSQPSSKRKCDDSAPLAEPAKRGKPPSSNAKVVRRNLPEKPVKPLADATPPLVSSRSKVLPSSITKAKGSSTVDCSL
ncbi:hypothetical protein PIB30_064036 [Stylosanthes scabra]|uniref:Aminotransferase-like plant mobile domain-containing protein n=1 Tax=Stylosanthes scabra TaxID=79078 RepID=A0ABU6VK23_9FABA|nr:hypothetical protein [Stylosanthes scabra]